MAKHPDFAKDPVYNVNDKFGRKFLGELRLVRDFCRNYADREVVPRIDWAGLKREPPNFIDPELRELFADLILSAPVIDLNAKSRVVIVPEHKSYIDGGVLLQLHAYLTHAWLREWNDAGRPLRPRLSAPILIVLYHGAEPWDDLRRTREIVVPVPGTEKFIPDFEFTLVDLARTPVEKIRGGPIVRSALEAMKRASDGSLADELPSVFRPFKDLPPDPFTREWLRNIAFYTGQAAPVSEQALAGALKPYLKPKEIEEMSGSFILEAAAKAAAKAAAEAAAEATAKAKAESLLMVLEGRFDEIPETVRSTIAGLTDIPRLDTLTRVAVAANSLDEFVDSL